MKKFTLIELLVVVAILGILVSILLPSIQKARAATIRAVCINNQKQLGIAFVTYSDSSNGNLPAPPSAKYTWDDLLSSYDGRTIPSDWDFEGNNSTGASGGRFESETWANQSKLYQCPVDLPNGDKVDRSYAVNSGSPDNWSGSRGPIMSGWWTENGSISEPWSMKLEAINEPSTAILMGELALTEDASSHLGHNSNNTRGNWKSEVDNSPLKHGRQLSLNYLFSDLHVAFLSIHALNGNSGKYLWGGTSDVSGTWLDCRD
ncbi:MAG: type II secretion system GspH family protein [Lentisphaeraceae bacterium]|nr:type II secretion system GspH family protein [Lentisphaeraceae bacterium]